MGIKVAESDEATGGVCEGLIRLVKISRFIAWPIGPILFAYPLIANDIPFGKTGILLLILLSVPFCLLLFGLNDIFDRNTDLANPRKRKEGFIHGVCLKESEYGKVGWICGAVASAIISVAFSTGKWQTVAAAVSLLGMAVVYSAPPLRLKSRPPLDSLANAAIIYLIIVFGYTYVDPGLFVPHGEFLQKTVPLLIGIVAIHLFSTIMDAEADKAAGIYTVATRIGKKKTAALSSGLLFFAVITIHTKNPFVLIYLVAATLSCLLYATKKGDGGAAKITVFQAISFVVFGAGAAMFTFFRG